MTEKEVTVQTTETKTVRLCEECSRSDDAGSFASAEQIDDAGIHLHEECLDSYKTTDTTSWREAYNGNMEHWWHDVDQMFLFETEQIVVLLVLTSVFFCSLSGFVFLSSNLLLPTAAGLCLLTIVDILKESRRMAEASIENYNQNR